MLTPGGNWLLLVKPRTSRLRCLDQAGKRILWFVGFPLVYEVQNTLHLPALDIFQHNDQVFARVVQWRSSGSKDCRHWSLLSGPAPRSPCSWWCSSSVTHFERGYQSGENVGLMVVPGRRVVLRLVHLWAAQANTISWWGLICRARQRGAFASLWSQIVTLLCVCLLLFVVKCSLS